MNRVLESIKDRLLFVEELVYQEKPVTVVTIVAQEGDRFYAGTGKVVCMGTDIWDANLGYKMALGKAVKSVCLDCLLRDIKYAFNKNRSDNSYISSLSLFDGSDAGGNSESASRNNGSGSTGDTAECTWVRSRS